MRQGVLIAADQAENEGLHASSDRSAEASAEFADLRLDLREGGRQSGGTRDQHDVEGYSRGSSYRTIRQEAKPRRLADPAPGSVAGDRTPDLPAGADPDPGAGGPPHGGESHQGARRIETAPGEQALKVAAGGQTRALFQTDRGPGPTGQVMSARAEPRPALAPAILDDPSAAHRAHPLHETVNTAAITLLGLVCPLDFGRPLFFVLIFSRESSSNPFRLNSRSIRIVFAACQTACQLWCNLETLRAPRPFARIPARRRSWGTAARVPNQTSRYASQHHSIHGLWSFCG